MPKKICFVFDLDETLIHHTKTAKEQAKKTYYMRINPTGKHKQMIKLFKFLYITKQKVFILTNRHPDVRKKISRYLNFPEKNILCRNYALDPKIYKRVPYSKVILGKFMKNMITDKVRTLNKLAATYGHVIFYDDNANRFLNNPALNSKVSVFYPIHLQKKKS